MADFIRFAATLNADIIENEPMKRHTTFKIGGPARYFALPKDTDSLKAICEFCRENDLPLFLLGNGSNLLVSDAGIDGVTVTLKYLSRIAVEGETVFTEAGASLMDVCRSARNAGLTGLEFAYGIPGTAGGAVYMNAGAYGGEMKDVVTLTEHLSEDGAGQFGAQELRFSYRHSVYSEGGRIITGVRFSLHPGSREKIDERMNELFARRTSKQPLEYPSAGSVFKRPEGHYAGTMIDGCGLKGLRVGGAMVSEKHANFIVNVGDATCADVLGLMEKIKQEVFRQTGIELESEIKVVGRP